MLKTDFVNLEHEFDNIIKNNDIKTLFQPIVSLETGEIFGYEDLSRGPENSFFYRPDNLFDYAKKKDRLWDLDLLCRIKAIESFFPIIKDKFLFINIDPEVINDSKFKKGFTMEYIEKQNINSENIIIEITEHSGVNDYSTFNQILDHYRDQGFRIAIDDSGAGYSGLRLMTEVRPSFIKIDMALVRDVDKDMIKKELLKSICMFAKIANIIVIAEGIETYDEMKTLINIGIQYGQGYYFQKPSIKFEHLNQNIKNDIIELNHLKTNRPSNKKDIKINHIVRRDLYVSPETTCDKINEIFSKSSSLQGIAVVNENKPIGLIMRSKFYRRMSYGIKLKNLEMPISSIMDKFPLVLDDNSLLKEASRIAMSRDENRLYDYIIVTKGNNYFGVIPVGYLLNEFINN